jgi:protein phosphatase
MSGWVGIGRSEIGLVRVSNQDAFTANDQFGLWAVADGMGGHVGGAIAAQVAIASVKARAESLVELLRQGQCTPTELLTNLVIHAHAAILERAQSEPRLKGMGTTIVLLFISPQENSTAHIAHLGDSRAYRFRSGVLTALTRDHTLIEQYLVHGILTEEAARLHPDRHVLTRALGMASPVSPTVTSISLHREDLLVLCSDGLTKMLEDDDIRAICDEGRGDPLRICDRLIVEALRRGGEDNVTVVVVAHA